MPSLPRLVSRVSVAAARAIVCLAFVSAGIDAAEAKPRVERITERRLMRLETMERRIEAAAELPPRPADVRRALRSGVPFSGMGPNQGPATTAARPVPRTTPPRAVAPQPRPPVAAARPRTVAPPQARPVPSPAVEPPQPVSPAAAVDDGTRSVLVGGEPTLAAPAAAAETIEPIELLPPPPAK